MNNKSNTLFYELRNVGYIDRAARITLGTVAIFATLLMVSGTLGMFAVIPLIAVYPILTGLIAFDPFYYIADIETINIGALSDRSIENLVRQSIAVNH